MRLPALLDHLEYWENNRKACIKITSSAFLVFSWHSVWVNNAGKLIENVVYCFYEIIMENICWKDHFVVILWRSRYLFFLRSWDDEEKPIKAAELEWTSIKWSYFFFLGGLFLPPAAGFTTFTGFDCFSTATWVSSCSIFALIVVLNPWKTTDYLLTFCLSIKSESVRGLTLQLPREPKIFNFPIFILKNIKTNSTMRKRWQRGLIWMVTP